MPAASAVSSVQTLSDVEGKCVEYAKQQGGWAARRAHSLLSRYSVRRWFLRQGTDTMHPLGLLGAEGDASREGLLSLPDIVYISLGTVVKLEAQTAGVSTEASLLHTLREQWVAVYELGFAL